LTFISTWNEFLLYNFTAKILRDISYEDKIYKNLLTSASHAGEKILLANPAMYNAALIVQAQLVAAGAGYRTFSDGFADHIRYLTLPPLSLGLVQAAYITRMTRRYMLDVRVYRMLPDISSGKIFHAGIENRELL